MRQEIRIAGFGGQGIVLSGRILGECAVNSGKNAVQTQSYGPESRGGAARSEIIIADQNIDYPRVIEADVLVALSQPGLDKYHSQTKKKGKIFIDSGLVEAAPTIKHSNIIEVPFTKTAEKVGRKIVANIVMLGYLTPVLKFTTKNFMKKTILDNIPKGTEKLNVKAFEQGYKLGMKMLK
ncbi:MAG: 2-oxoacid:acceptor oxidoreductase family protein [Thermoplasmata archaeon]|nr:2-oxoacid:acceptor oxidoreductase family protein [Thermoplasmata archaeon]